MRLHVKQNKLKLSLIAAAVMLSVNAFAAHSKIERNVTIGDISKGSTQKVNTGYASTVSYIPNITIGGFYGNNNRSYGQLDALIPLNNNPYKLFFADIRGLSSVGSNSE